MSFSGYRYDDAELNHSHQWLLPSVLKVLDRLDITDRGGRRLFELGCGNGSVARLLVARGWHVIGVDPSEEGIAHALSADPALNLSIGSAYDDLAAKYGRFLWC